METASKTAEKRPLTEEVIDLTVDEDDSTTQKPQNDGDADNSSAPKKRKISRIECIVCMSDVAKNQFPKLPHSTDGGDVHDSQVCFKCWKDHLKSEIGNNEVESIACPQCTKVLDEAEIRRLASATDYERYIKRGLKECLDNEEEYRACPNADCSWGAFFVQDDGNIFSCQMCSARHCLLCDVPFHEDQTCDEYQEAKQRAVEEEEVAAKRRVEEETASAEAVKKMSRPCPECGVNIDKYVGCDHVTCRKCRHEFCWECFAPYMGDQGIRRIGNTAHVSSCRYHPRRLYSDED